MFRKSGGALTIGVKKAESDHGARVTFVSGLLVPLARLGIVLRQAEAVHLEKAEVPHGFRVVLGSGLLVPLACLGIVPLHAVNNSRALA
jgi:hypothetical protein